MLGGDCFATAWADLSLLLVSPAPPFIHLQPPYPQLFLRCVEFSSNGCHQEQVCPGLHTAWSFCLTFPCESLADPVVMTTGHMADGKGEVKRTAPRDIRYDTNAKGHPKPFLLWLRELVVTSFPCGLRGTPWP